MDVILLLAVVICGFGPVGLMAWWSFKQGRKGYNEAVTSRDEAMKVLSDVSRKLQHVDNDLTLMKSSIMEIPTKEVILNSVQKSIQGTYGRLIRSGKEAVQGEIDELAQDVRNNMSPEEVQAAMGQKMLGALQNKIMSFFE